MPIYEYEALNPKRACEKCAKSFEIIQGHREKPLRRCMYCGQKVRKVISRCHGAIVETPEESQRVERKISEYEKKGMWSHAAELADNYSEKTKDSTLKVRALESYEKAGYDSHSLEKHVKNDNN
jgi:putative FmdB family regulatory protein